MFLHATSARAASLRPPSFVSPPGKAHGVGRAAGEQRTGRDPAWFEVCRYRERMLSNKVTWLGAGLLESDELDEALHGFKQVVKMEEDRGEW